jgi:exopolysaccharide biosynthesis operon protein EpsL
MTDVNLCCTTADTPWPNPFRSRPRSGVAGGLVAALAWLVIGSDPASAAMEPAAEEGFSVRLSESLRWDDNLFRLPDGVRPVDGGSRSDRLSQTAVGLHFDHVYSLQRLIAGVTVVDRRYAEHANQDSTTVDGVLRWNWALGSLWSGNLGLLQREAPRSFADTVRRVRSINTLRRLEGDAEYRWHPAWVAVVGAEQTASRYSDSQSSASEYDETAVEVGAGFRPKSGNRLDLVARYADGSYPNRSPSATIDSDYTQRDLRLRGDWRVSGLSRFSGYVGLTSRAYPHVESLDFSGATGRLVFDWTPTGKLSFRTTVRREIGSEDEVIDNFVVSRAISFEPRWLATDKVTLWSRLEWLRRDFGQSSQPLQDGNRTRSYGLGLIYQPLRSATVGASFQHSVRSAPGPLFDYSDKIFGLDLKVGF